MQPNFAAACVLFALVLLAILRWHVALPISESAAPSQWPASGDPATEAAQKGRDRPGRSLWPIGLSAAVAVTAALRVALLFTLHA